MIRNIFFSFYEVSIPTKTINFVPLAIDMALYKPIQTPLLDHLYGTRRGYWYIAIEIYNDLEKDCLADDSLSQTPVLRYLRKLKKEYISTYNYNEILFKN